MAFLAKIGEFSVDPNWTLNSLPVVDCVGFPPKAAIFFYIRTTASGNVIQSSEGNVYNFGMAVASTRTIGRFLVESAGTDGKTDEYGFWKCSYNNRIIHITQSGYLGSVDGYLDFQTFTGSGFQFYIRDVFTQPYKINYLALGGDSLSDVFSATRLRINVSGFFELAETGFKPSALFELSSDYSYQSSSVAVQDFAVGVADNNMNQGVAYHGYTDFGEPSPYRALGHCASGQISAGIWRDEYPGIYDRAAYWTDTLTSFTNNGFTMYHNPIPSGTTTTNSYYHYLAMKGGLWKVGYITTRADDMDIDVELGFKPTVIVFISGTKEQDSYEGFSQEGSVSFGVATSPTDRRVISVWNDYVETESGFPLSVASAQYIDAVYANITDGTLISSMDLKSINDTGFVCKMDNYVDPEDRLVIYMAWGDEVPVPATATGNDKPRVFMI